jgi:hypothetical protein
MPLEDLRLPDDVPTPQRGHHFVFRGHLLSFDQSLAHTGWVYLDFTYPDANPEATHGVVIRAHGDLKSPIKLDGHEANLERAVALIYEYRQVLMNTMVFNIVHELPPTANRMQRPESSLLAALALHYACDVDVYKVHMISAQKAKTIWTGNPNASKPMIKEHLLDWWPELEAERYSADVMDAIANGLAWAEQ